MLEFDNVRCIAEGSKTAARAWRTREPSDLRWHNWDQAHFVFDPASGQTHFLNELGAFIVDLLSNSTLTIDEIRSAIQDHLDTEYDPLLVDALHDTVGELDNLGLIEAS